MTMMSEVTVSNISENQPSHQLHPTYLFQTSAFVRKPRNVPTMMMMTALEEAAASRQQDPQIQTGLVQVRCKPSLFQKAQDYHLYTFFQQFNFPIYKK